MMEGVLLNLFSGNDGLVVHHSRPQVSLTDLDSRLSLLQANALDRSTVHGYATGARDYLHFCLQHHLPFDPTPLTLARYIPYTFKIHRVRPSLPFWRTTLLKGPLSCI